MKKYFNTIEGAERHLEVRRQAAYKRIAKKGWKIVNDSSFVGQDCFRENQDKEKWVVFLMISTDEMIKDLKNEANKFDNFEAELEKILNDKKTKDI